MANWYGIKGLKFVWHGEWSDPGVIYRGVEVNSTIPEDTMWERWLKEEKGDEKDDKGFARYMKTNADEVKYLITLAMKPIAVKCICNWGGIEILDIDSDYVTHSENYGDGRYGIATSQIRYNMKGDPFFIRKGKREYLRDYMRV